MMENITALYRSLLEARQRQTAARLAWRKARRSNKSEADARRRDYQLTTQFHRQLLTKITAGLAALTDPSDQRFLDWPLLNHQRAYPFLLAPVRLETRFQKRDGQNALLVRIYPDTCSINTVDLNTVDKAAQRREEGAGINPFIPEPTTEEILAARKFWCRYWAAGGDESVQRAAWKEIAGACGSGRAHWVLLQHLILKHFQDISTGTEKPYKEPPLPADTIRLVIATEEAEWPKNRTKIEQDWKNYWLSVDKNAEKYTQYQVLYFPKRPEDAENPKVQFSWLQFPPAQVTEEPELETYAQLMPDFFVLFAERKAKMEMDQEKDYFRIVTGKPIAKPLAVSPFQSADGNLWESEEIRWMADFDEAVEKGMAIVLPDLTQEDMQKGFDRIFVLGVRLIGAPEIARVELAQLFAAHYAARAGFEILPQGTPTNNTEETGAGYARRDDLDAGFDRLAGWFERITEPLRNGKPTKPKPGTSGEGDAPSDGRLLEQALGLPPDQLQYAPNYQISDQQEASHMNALLYPGTLGYYLHDMMKNVEYSAPPLLRDDPFIREFFRELVHGRGTLPAIRIGRQPYGILPTMAFSASSSAAPTSLFDSLSGAHAFRSNLSQLLYNLYAQENPDYSWTGAMAGRVPHVGQEQGVTAETILQMLGLHAGSAEFYKRYATNSGNVASIPDESDIKLLLKSLKKKLTTEENEEADPQILNLRYADHDEEDAGHWLLKGPIIDDKPLSETETVNIRMTIRPIGQSRTEDGDEETTNYLQWLSGHVKDWQEFTVEFPDHENPPLLYQLVTWALQQNNTEDQQEDPQQEALAALAQCPTARLDRLLSEHLDCLSYRLDAWISGLISWRLQSMRAEHPTGIHLGAYGWVEKVKPKSSPSVFDEGYANEFTAKVGMGGKEHGDTAQALNLRDLHDNPVFVDGTNAGYIHAPSLNQGVTAALLRSGAVSNGDSAAPGPYAVNLSSERVRRGLTIVEGIRQGQDPGALLGYQLERFLHDASDESGVELHLYIYPLREAFPIEVSQQETPVDEIEEATEALSARNVIDGLKLIRALESSDLSHEQFVVKYLPELVFSNKKKEREAMASRIERLQDVFDGLADLALAESVHHAAQGNYERAGAHLDAYSRGGYPPEHDLIRTPRSVSYRDPESTSADYQTGVTLTHRVALHLDPKAAPGATPRAKANPALNQWLSGIIPDMNIGRVENADQPEMGMDLKMTDLGLEPIDLLYIQPAALEELAIYTALKKNTDLKLSLHLSFDPSPLKKLNPILHTLRKLILKTRPIEPADLTNAGNNKTAAALAIEDFWSHDLKYNLYKITLMHGFLQKHIRTLAKLQKVQANGEEQKPSGRTDDNKEDSEADPKTQELFVQIKEILADLNDQLRKYAADSKEPPEDQFPDFKSFIASVQEIINAQNDLKALLFSTGSTLKSLASYGMSQTSFGFLFDEIPEVIMESKDHEQTAEEKVKRLIAFTKNVRNHLLNVAEEIVGILTESDPPTAAQKLFGEQFLLLPSFAPADNWTNAPEITYYDPHDPNNENPDKELIIDDWFHGVARVREKMGQWEKMTFLAEALGRPSPALTPKQIGPETGKKNYWLAAEYPEDHRVQGDYLLYTYAGAPPGENICGLLLDEWTEIIPGDTEVTGLAFHFDRPNAEAPQALLLVAPPQFDGAWTLRDLLDALRETLQMAKTRAVEPDQLLTKPYAQLLPAVFMDFKPSILE